MLVSGLPPSGSWQDLKDHMREAGDVVYTDVFRDGTGVVEFARRDDMRWAVKNLSDSKFKSHEVIVVPLILATRKLYQELSTSCSVNGS